MIRVNLYPGAPEPVGLRGELLIAERTTRDMHYSGDLTEFEAARWRRLMRQGLVADAIDRAERAMA